MREALSANRSHLRFLEERAMDSRIPDYFFAQFGIAGLIVLGTLAVLFKLSADFAKMRTDLQQEVTRDLLNNRLAAYDILWSKMRGLALYDEDPLTATNVRRLSSQLSDWYFGKNGGLFLTIRTREFYFALQDVLRVAGRLPDWECAARPTGTRELFANLVAELTRRQVVVGFRLADMERPESLNPRVWRDLCKLVGAHLLALASKNESPPVDAIFAIIQQVSSALRTNLAEGLQTRAETNAPRPWARALR